MSEIVSTLADRVVARKVIGDPDNTLVKKLCNLGLEEKIAQAAISEIISDRLKSEAKLRRWRRHLESLLDAHRTLRQLSPDASVISRLHKPDPDDFFENY